MKCSLLLSLAAASTIAPWLNPAAQAAPVTVEILRLIDYPGAATTHFSAINDNNEIAGFFTTAPGDFTGYGFTFANGHFSAPLDDPDDAHMQTQARGINNAGTVCGNYWGADNVHGFFFSDGTYTNYDFPGQTGTIVSGINNNGDFVGYIFGFAAFKSIGGNVTPITIPDGTYVTPNGINDNNQIAGFYDSYGFYSTPTGELIYPIVGPGAKNTYLYGINNRGWMVGGYVNGSGHNRMVHGLLFIPPNQYVTVDYNGAFGVTLTGINNKGFICGYYTDSSGAARGLLARVRRSGE
jgi:hypothetical protein